MRILHRVSVTNPSARKELAKCGVVVGRDLEVIELEEGHTSWSCVRDWIRRTSAFDFAYTVFSDAEVSAARWVEVLPEWHHGYPQPRDDEFGYRNVTYELSDHCEVCGIGLRQKAPFQMSAEPKWGRRGILQLNWVLDEYFVTPAVWGAVFEPFGIERRPVTNVAGRELGTVVQLVVPHEADVSTEGLVALRCEACDRTKYEPFGRGPFCEVLGDPAFALFKSRQYFGSGGAADQAVLMSRELAEAFRNAKIRGASLRPAMKWSGRLEGL